MRRRLDQCTEHAPLAERLPPTFGNHHRLADGQQGQQEGGVRPQQRQQRPEVVQKVQAGRLGGRLGFAAEAARGGT